jgi:hypothetical protein
MSDTNHKTETHIGLSTGICVNGEIISTGEIVKLDAVGASPLEVVEQWERNAEGRICSDRILYDSYTHSQYQGLERKRLSSHRLEGNLLRSTADPKYVMT